MKVSFRSGQQHQRLHSGEVLPIGMLDFPEWEREADKTDISESPDEKKPAGGGFVLIAF
jgi:hypothetical protein